MKTLKLNQIEILSNGIVQLRFHKLDENGEIIGYHRTAMPPGYDIDAHMVVMNNQMAENNFAAINQEDVTKIKDHSSLAWNTELIASYRASIDNMKP